MPLEVEAIREKLRLNQVVSQLGAVAFTDQTQMLRRPWISPTRSNDGRLMQENAAESYSRS